MNQRMWKEEGCNSEFQCKGCGCFMQHCLCDNPTEFFLDEDGYSYEVEQFDKLLGEE